MFDSIRKRLANINRSTKIPTTAHIMENSLMLHGEDPGTIPPDDIPNPLTDEVKE